MEKNISPGVWITNAWNLNMVTDDMDFVVVEIESEGDYQGVVSLPTPEIPHAIITNFSPFARPDGAGYDAERAKPLIDKGWACLTEAYLGDNLNATPDNLHFIATNLLGWDYSQPVFGVYNASIATYLKWRDWPGCSYYLAEYIL